MKRDGQSGEDRGGFPTQAKTGLGLGPPILLQLGLETIGEGKAKENRLKPSEEVEKNPQPG